MANGSHGPIAALAVSLVAGVEIIIVSIIIMILGAVITEPTQGGSGAIYGIIGIVWGILVIICAYMMYSRRQKHVLWGALVIAFSVVSIFGALGGVFIGLILGVIGGVLGIVWNPDKKCADDTGSVVTFAK